MKTINFSFTIHNHQPTGNFESILEDAFRDCYRPFLDVLRSHPGVRFTQHWTGTLLEWLVRRHPEFIREMKKLVRRGQLELLTGSYYEAILPIIPEDDRVGQIRKLSGAIEELFGFKPRGLWLAERVWEPHLVSTIAAAGLEFVVLDDAHFRMAGIGDDGLTGYYRTEDCGNSIAVFPIDKTLRYTIPFHTIEETKHHLQGVAEEQAGRLLVHADDGEKFGVWPKTHHSVYEEGWLEDFCTFLEDNQNGIRTVHLGETLDSTPPKGRIYLPTASYPEMMKWVLPAPHAFRLERFEQQLKATHAQEEGAMFVRGGFWRNFLAKYPEANHMHKKMLRVSSRMRLSPFRKRIKPEVTDLVWGAQCNDAYWHGVFGGLYLPNLRHPIYRNLILAEAALDHVEGVKETRVETVDFDCDGQEEILLESTVLNLYCKPSTGGHLIELDYKPLGINLLDILSRREEVYHHRLLARSEGQGDPSVTDDLILKEAGLEKELYFDWYRHASLVDHFLADGTTLDMFRKARYLELGDFVDQPFAATVDQHSRRTTIRQHREGALWPPDGKPHRIVLTKDIVHVSGSDSYEVSYEIENAEKNPVDIWFGVELNVGLLAGDASDRYYDIEGRPLQDCRLRSTGEEKDVRDFRLVDEWQMVETRFGLSSPATLWRSPVETTSLSEAGLERVYQSSLIFPHWRVRLSRSFSVRITQSVRRLRQTGAKKVRRGK
jgi:alpha-amylase